LLADDGLAVRIGIAPACHPFSGWASSSLQSWMEMGWVVPMEFVIVADVEVGVVLGWWVWGTDRHITRVFMYLLVTVSALWRPKTTSAFTLPQLHWL
jgi:hypothetical protein